MDSVLTSNLSRHGFISSMLPQSFGLPYGFMSYIQEKQNSKVYEKLIKTCKYFFYSKGFVVVVDWYDSFYNQLGYFGKEIMAQIDLPEKNQRGKFWVKKSIFVCSRVDVPSFYPLNPLTKSLYRCDNIALNFRKQSLKYKELKVLSEVGTFKEISFSICQIVDKNGAEVFLEDIMALFPRVKKFKISNYKLRCSSKTAKALAIFSKLKQLVLWGIPEVFNIEDFIIFIKTHETLEYFIDFNPAAPATYVTAFKNAISSVCTNWDSDSHPPTFKFFGC